MRVERSLGFERGVLKQRNGLVNSPAARCRIQFIERTRCCGQGLHFFRRFICGSRGQECGHNRSYSMATKHEATNISGTSETDALEALNAQIRDKRDAPGAIRRAMEAQIESTARRRRKSQGPGSSSW